MLEMLNDENFKRLEMFLKLKHFKKLGDGCL